MPPPLYTQTVIAMVWDFDRTLIPGYQQQPLLEQYGVDPGKFWDEVNALPEYYKSIGVVVNKDTAYLGHILTYVREGRFPGLNNARLREIGATLRPCRGMPEFMDAASKLVAQNERLARHDISVEHYIVSTGHRPMIEGSVFGNKVRKIWACDYIETPAPVGYAPGTSAASSGALVTQIGSLVDNTSKTRAVFEINKGDGVDVNALIDPSQRRVPFKNMIYVADGPSDVPVFSLVNRFGGKTFGVWNEKDERVGSKDNFALVRNLQNQGRIQGMGKADYSQGTDSYRWLMAAIEEIAHEIASTREQVLKAFPEAPRHIT